MDEMEALRAEAKDLRAKLEQAERERDTTQTLALRKCVELTDRATAAESAKAEAERGLARARERMVAAFGEGTTEEHLVEISHAAEKDAYALDDAIAALRLAYPALSRAGELGNKETPQ
jgi:hypothetical protein